METTVAIVFAVGLVGAAVLVLKRHESAPPRAGTCSQVGQLDAKAGAACSLAGTLASAVKSALTTESACNARGDCPDVACKSALFSDAQKRALIQKWLADGSLKRSAVPTSCLKYLP